MIKSVSALLVGASLLASAPASAADYIRYDIVSAGTFYQTANGTSTSGIISFGLTLTLPSSAAGQTTYTFSPNFDPYSRPFTLTTSATGFTVSANQSADERTNGRSTINISAGVCASVASLIGSFGALTPGCVSTITYSQTANLGYGYRYSGTIDTVSVSTFTGDANTAIGIVQTVPEPATWTMMLVGFGAVGVVLRNRRRRVAVAA